MIEESIKKQSTIAALSKVSILHDPTLVEDLSELRSVPRFLTEEGDESVSGSVIVTKRAPLTNEINTNVSNDNNNSSDNEVKSDVEDVDSKRSRITSMCSSNYSNDSTEMEMNQGNGQGQEQQISSGKIDLYGKDNIALLESKKNKEISNIQSEQENNHRQIIDITNNKEEDEEVLGNNKGNYEDDDEYNLNMEYSDSDFEYNLEQRMMHLDTESEITPLSARESTITPLNSGSTTPHYEYSDEEKDHNLNEDNISQQIIEEPNIHNKTSENHLEEEGKELRTITGDDEEEEEEEEEEEFEDEEDYQPLPPPEELDPDKLYALYAFNGPDPSHCQLEQDEPCILLNDEDAYWWLVKRCRDNNIGFAPAELLETFPERLARLNCWKNENMTLSTTNSLQSLDLINQNERKQQEQLKIKMASSLKLPYKSNKNEKSVSFSNIITYAKRYFEEISEDEDNDIKDNNNTYDDNNNNNYTNSNDKIALKVKEDNKIHKYSHIDEFTNEVISYNRKSGFDENNSDIVSDVSFNTGCSQPLNVVKIRESKSIKNIHREIINEKPEGSDKEVETSSNIQGLGIKELNIDKESEGADSHLNNINDNHDINKDGVEKYEENPKPFNSSVSDLHKIFEAPIIPFGGSNSNNMKKSTSDYSISTIGEFSPSSSEWTNDSPNLKNTDNIDPNNPNTEKNVFSSKLESSHIPSTKAVRDISKLVEDLNLPPENEDTELEDTLQEHSDNNDIKENTDNSMCDDITDINKEIKVFTDKLPDITSSLSTESNTVSSVDEEFEIYMENRELQMSTTSMASNNSLHRNQKSIDVSNIVQLADVKPTINYTERQNSTTLTATFKHPLVQEMYDPILTKIDILMNKIDDIIRH